MIRRTIARSTIRRWNGRRSARTIRWWCRRKSSESKRWQECTLIRRRQKNATAPSIERETLPFPLCLFFSSLGGNLPHLPHPKLLNLLLRCELNASFALAPHCWPFLERHKIGGKTQLSECIKCVYVFAQIVPTPTLHRESFLL